MPHAPETFVHLHNHTEFSLLDGASRIHALVEAAAKLEMPALAITDHGVMYGAIHFYKACKDAGIKPIVGCEVYVAPRSRLLREGRVDRDPNHLTLLAANHEGYVNLMKLCTVGQMEGMYYKPRIDKEILAEHSKGIIALSGCLQGEAASRITEGDLDGAREAVASYKDIFGADRFLLEVQRHGIDRQDKVNEALGGFGKEFGLRLCATNDLHYVHRHDSESHDVLLCLQTNARFNDPNRWRFSSQENYLKTPEEMRTTFADLPDALASTIDVADMVDLKLHLGATLLPPFDVPDGLSPDQYLRKLVEEGVRWRFEKPTAEITERANNELTVISQTGYASYFLIVWDFYKFARQQGIVVGPGRGSAAGSLGDHQPRPDQARPDLRALLEHRPSVDARHRLRLLGRGAREGHQLCLQEVRGRPGRPDHHLHDHGLEGGDSRRGPGVGGAAARHRSAGQARAGVAGAVEEPRRRDQGSA